MRDWPSQSLCYLLACVQDVGFPAAAWSLTLLSCTSLSNARCRFWKRTRRSLCKRCACSSTWVLVTWLPSNHLNGGGKKMGDGASWRLPCQTEGNSTNIQKNTVIIFTNCAGAQIHSYSRCKECGAWYSVLRTVSKEAHISQIEMNIEWFDIGLSLHRARLSLREMSRRQQPFLFMMLWIFGLVESAPHRILTITVNRYAHEDTMSWHPCHWIVICHNTICQFKPVVEWDAFVVMWSRVKIDSNEVPLEHGNHIERVLPTQLVQIWNRTMKQKGYCDSTEDHAYVRSSQGGVLLVHFNLFGSTSSARLWNYQFCDF